MVGLGADEGRMNALELRRVVDLLNRELYGFLKLNLWFRRQGVGGMTSLIMAPRNWWRGHRWGVRIEPPGDEAIKLVTEAICYETRECMRNRLVPTPRTYVSAKAISLPRRPVITSAIPELVGGKLIGLVNLLVPAAFTRKSQAQYNIPLVLTEKMLQLITCRLSVTNGPLALSASTAPAVSALLIGEPTPLTEATSPPSKSRYQHFILLHLRPQNHLVLLIPSSLMYQT
ncbi:hypothetical protein DVH24_033293 [Malus domestica]|uniref:Uncharacterized protein n=1 Tax=Malus domestica TaxID=3750 RepID=A0A498JC77_MALDO|nr:hypothetical protein DVH24_033293 [Malus domestica]